MKRTFLHLTIGALLGGGLLAPVTVSATTTSPQSHTFNGPVIVRGGTNRLVQALNEPPANLSGVSIGVFGQSTGPTGRGVVGFATSPTGDTYGVIGRNYSPSGAGVYGHAHNTAGQNAGVIALTDSQSGRGLFAEARANNGINFGVFARSLSPQGRGVVGVVSATAGLNYGVVGRSLSPGGVGVWGHAPATSGQAVGVYGQTTAPQGAGVVGVNESGANNSVGIRGMGRARNGSFVFGVVGTAESVDGHANNRGFGVAGLNYTPHGHGVYGHASGPGGIAIYGHNPSGRAGYFHGNVVVSGNLTIRGNLNIAGATNMSNFIFSDQATESNHGFMSCKIYNRFGSMETTGEDVVVRVVFPPNHITVHDQISVQLTAVDAPMPNLHVKHAGFMSVPQVCQPENGETCPPPQVAYHFTIAGNATGKVNWTLYAQVCQQEERFRPQDATPEQDDVDTPPPSLPPLPPVGQ